MFVWVSGQTLIISIEPITMNAEQSQANFNIRKDRHNHDSHDSKSDDVISEKPLMFLLHPQYKYWYKIWRLKEDTIF